MKLSTSDWQTISNALGIAADQYVRDAETVREHPRLSKQFKRQSSECERLAAQIEEEAP